MLKKENRLIKQSDFTTVFKRGRSCFNKFLGIKVLNNNLPSSRLGISISLKVDKKAVKRNKLKRQIREIIKTHLPQIKPGYDILIIVLPAIKDQDFKQIECSILTGLKKLKIIN